MKNSNTNRVVIVGSGFAGINAAKTVAKAGVRVTLIDRTNHHLFQPLLYQIATAGLSPADIAVPIRSEFAKYPNVDVVFGEVSRLSCADRFIVLSDGREFEFEFLLLATGARHSYFGNAGWEVLAPGLKTIEDALELRRRILLAFENAELSHDEFERQAWLNFVVIGAGPTGVEMAGAIAELAKFALARDYRHVNLQNTKVLLLEAGPQILPSFDPKLAEATVRRLTEMGVEVRTGTRVTGISDHSVLIGDLIIPARTKVWAAGVVASPLAQQLGVPLDRAGRVVVKDDLSIEGYPNIFVAGDLAAYKLDDGRYVPGMAPAAIQQGKTVAENILRLMTQQPTQKFVYFDKGSMATVGRNFAIAEIGSLRFAGLMARLLWIFIHIAYLISFRNKLIVFLEWLWSYVTYKKGARLILSDASYLKQE